MLVRKVKAEEIPAMHRIQAMSFHGAVPRHEQPVENGLWPLERWGAFDDDGTIMGTVVDNQMTVRFDGHEVGMSGIGGVSTLPEYRYGNCIREIFREMLQEQYDRGVVFSSLFPFNHGFYGKFGYRYTRPHRVQTISTQLLRDRKFAGWAKPYHAGDDVQPYIDLYNDWSAHYNLSVPRTEAIMRFHLGSADPLTVRGENPHADRRFAYLLGEGEKVLASVVFDDVWRAEGPLLRLFEVCWREPAGLQAALGFLGRFSADYREIEWYLPTDLHLEHLVYDPYGVKEHRAYNLMARVVRADKALELLRRPADTRCIIHVSDPFLPRNDGSYLVTGQGVVRTEQPADLSLPVQVLAPLLLGGLTLDEALLQPDVVCTGKKELLRVLFPEKPMFIREGF